MCKMSVNFGDTVGLCPKKFPSVIMGCIDGLLGCTTPAKQCTVSIQLSLLVLFCDSLPAEAAAWRQMTSFPMEMK